MQIEYRQPAALKGYAKNSRNHDDSQIDQLAASMREFGFNNPILVDGEDEVIAGHGRLQAALRLKLDSVPVIVLAHLSDAQKRAYVIADNKLAENSTWDIDILRQEIDSLTAEGYGLDLLGFSTTEFDDFFGAPTKNSKAPRTDPDDVPAEPATPISQPGDVWLCGPHRVMCGDATNADAVALLVGDARINLWLTDPPYNVGYTGKTRDALTIKNDSMPASAFRQFLGNAYRAADSVMQPGAAFYIWHADIEGYNFRAAVMDAGWQLRECLIWNKSAFVLGRQDYHWKHEPCLYGWKSGAPHHWAGDRKQTTVLDFERPSRNESHPTMKPVALFEYLLLNSTKPQDIVLDSFGGSGTTLIAAEKNQRVARIMELDPVYCDVSIQRWQNYTGETATRESDGMHFPAN